MDLSVLPDTPFTFGDVCLSGVTRSQLYAWEAEGQVRRLVHGVFVRADAPDDLETRLAGLSRVLPPDQVVVDETAAWLHGVNTYAYAAPEAVPLHVCTPPGRSRVVRPDVDGRTRTLSESDVEVFGDVTVTTPLRTALDLGRYLRRREAFAAMCMLARDRGFTSVDVVRALPRFRGHRGVIQLRELAPLVEPRLESPREAWVLLAILDHGLPPPEPQVWVEVDGVPTYRLDLAYPRHRLCVEYDGEEFHVRTEEQRRRDHDRRRWLRDQGWTVVVVRSGDFSGPELDGWIRRLREALAVAYSPRRW